MFEHRERTEAHGLCMARAQAPQTEVLSFLGSYWYCHYYHQKLIVKEEDVGIPSAFLDTGVPL